MRTLAILGLALLASCGGKSDSSKPINPSEPLIDELNASDALLGTKGKIRVTLQNAATKDVDVALEISDANVLAAPATIRILNGSRVGIVDYDAKSTGTAVIHASINNTRKSTSARIATRLALNMYWDGSGGEDLQVGASTVIQVQLSARMPTDTLVSFIASNPTAIEIPPSVIVPAFSTTTYISIKGKAEGISRITGSVNDANTFLGVEVVTTPILTSLSTNGAFVVGEKAQVLVYLSAVVAKDVSVNLSSSNSQVFGVPASITVHAGNSGGSIWVTSLGQGTAELEAKLDTVSLKKKIAVSERNELTSVSCPSDVSLDATAKCTVSIAAPITTESTVELSANPPGILELPVSVKIPAGTSSATFSVKGLKKSSTLIEAKLNAYGRNSVVRVSSPDVLNGSFSFYSNQESGRVGDIGTLYLFPNSYDVEVKMSSSNPAVVSVPASYRAYYSSTIPFVFSSPGYAILSAEILGVKQYEVVQATAATSGTLYPVSIGRTIGSSIEVGVAGTFYVSASSSKPADVPFTIMAQTAGILDVASSGVLLARDYQQVVPVQAIMAGTTTVTVTAGVEIQTFNFTVVPKAQLTNVTQDPLAVKKSATLRVYVDATVAKDVSVALTQSGPGVISNLPSSIIIPTGTSSASLPVTGQTAGMVTITATLNSLNKTVTATISP